MWVASLTDCGTSTLVAEMRDLAWTPARILQRYPYRNRNRNLDACIPACRGKVRHANAEFFRANKNSEKELIVLCEQVKKAKLTLEENLNKREQPKRAWR